MQKGKIFLSLLSLAIAVALIGGATLAWFTDTTAAPQNVFQAGTVEIGADEKYVLYEDGMMNVNPGDCFVKCFEIENIGTKSAEFRLIDFLGVWTISEEEWGPVRIAPVPGSDWVMKERTNEQGEKVYDFYYTGGPVPGTFAVANGDALNAERFVQLCILVIFDGEGMVDAYQGKEFKLNGEFQAIQASNDAPADQWADGWDQGWFAMGHKAALVAGVSSGYADYFYDSNNFKFDACVAKGHYYIGLEDLPQDGDFDYNDHGMSFAFNETYVGATGAEKLKSITMSFHTLVNGAGFDHHVMLERFGLDNSNIPYSYTIKRYDRNPSGAGETPPGAYSSALKPFKDVVLFDTTRYPGIGTPAPHRKMYDRVNIVLVFDEPVDKSQVTLLTNPYSSSRGWSWGSDLSESLYPYDFKIKKAGDHTTIYAEMGNVLTLDGVTVPGVTVPGVTVPKILVVPQPGFAYPNESQVITGAYPDFLTYYQTGSPANWYETNVDWSKVIQPWP